MSISPNAGKLAPKEILENIPNLVTTYYTKKPDLSDPTQLISFGTSGHRGTALKGSFNEDHILAVTQAVAEYRKDKVKGALFIGMDTHALSIPAHTTALEVLAANEVTVYYAKDFEYTPTPVISHAILNNKDTDGIVITPSHNPPSDGGFKYNPSNGGPADVDVTSVIEKRANEILKNGLAEVKRMPIDEALESEYLIAYDFITPYVDDLPNVIDIDAIKKSNIKIGADAMGGSGMAYYKAIKERYGLNMELFHDKADFTFSFMHCDKDGKIRMDCSSPYAMAGLVDMKDDFDIAFGNDTDFDRHGIVTKSVGLMNPNHYLSVAIDYLYKTRDFKGLGVGKTLVSSSMIDRFVEPLINGEVFFGGEESAGASFLRKDGKVWSTDKDGIILTLLSAEILATTKKDPGVYYKELFALRPSGTEDVYKIYAESFIDEDHLKAIQSEAQEIVKALF